MKDNFGSSALTLLFRFYIKASMQHVSSNYLNERHSVEFWKNVEKSILGGSVVVDGSLSLMADLEKQEENFVDATMFLISYWYNFQVSRTLIGKSMLQVFLESYWDLYTRRKSEEEITAIYACVDCFKSYSLDAVEGMIKDMRKLRMERKDMEPCDGPSKRARTA